MLIVKLTGYFGNEQKNVEVREPVGNAGTFHLLINNYYQGCMFKRQGRWVGHFNSTDFTSDDVLVLGDLIDQSLKNGTANK